MICLYIEIHNYRQLHLLSPDTVERISFELRSLAALCSAEEYSGISGGRLLFSFGEAHHLKNRPRAMDAVYNTALKSEAALRAESKELYGYKLVLENLSELDAEAVHDRIQALMMSVPEEDTLWLTPQVAPLFNGRLEASTIVQHSSRWYCLPPTNSSVDAENPAAKGHVETENIQGRLLDVLGVSLNNRCADCVYEFRSSNSALVAQELHSAFQHYCGMVDDPPYLKLVGNKEHATSAYESLRQTLATIDPEWLQQHLPLAGKRIVRELHANLSERTAFRFGSDPVQLKDYKLMLGLVVDAFRGHAEASHLPFLLILQDPGYMDRASRAVVQSFIGLGQASAGGSVEPIPVVLSSCPYGTKFIWAAPIYSYVVATQNAPTTPPQIPIMLESVLDDVEIVRITERHSAALHILEEDPTEVAKSYDQCSTEVRRLRSEFGDALCARYVNLRTGIHPRVVVALEWAGRQREAFMLWNDLFNSAIEHGCVPEAGELLGSVPLSSHDLPAQADRELAIKAGYTRLRALSPDCAAGSPSTSQFYSVGGLEAQGTLNRVSGRADLNWILAQADRAVKVGDSALLKQCAKDAFMRAQELGDRESAGRAQLHLADSLLMLGRVTEAREYAGRVRSDAKPNSFGTHEHGLVLEGCAYFIDGNLTRVGEVLEALKKRESMVLVPAAFRVLRLVLGFRHAVELGRHDSARARLGELRQFLELIGKDDWALSLRSWDSLCMIGEGSIDPELVVEMQGAHYSSTTVLSAAEAQRSCIGMQRENQLIRAAALVSQGRASESLEQLSSLPRSDVQRSTIYLLRPPRAFMIEDQALGPEIVFERMLSTCQALALLQRGESMAAGELIGEVCRDATRTAVDPYRRLYLLVYSMALSRRRNPDDPDPGAVLGQAVRLLRERTARIEDPKEKLEFQRANPINRYLISLAREHNLW
ncbi:MAG: hypothetical protein EA428_06990 [Spirochaetaceae bacterium]|nr:MAG: hypothetical protein EA428_06990 [Spirochaetaceae bacterium]